LGTTALLVAAGANLGGTEGQGSSKQASDEETSVILASTQRRSEGNKFVFVASRTGEFSIFKSQVERTQRK